MSDLDTRVRAATGELLDRTIPDVSGRYAELGRTRTRRTTAKLAVVAAVVAVGVGWQLRLDPGQDIEPAPAPAPDSTRAPDPIPAPDSTRATSNGALLGLHDFAGDGHQSWGTAYQGTTYHLPTDAAAEPLTQFSPGGSTLYYSDDRQQLASWDLASGTKGVLMPCPVRGCLGGSISPDGSTGVFPGFGDFLVVDLATGRTTSVDSPVGDAGPMMWSPDGNRLAFLSSTGLWTMSPDGTDATQLREATTTSSRPPFSVSWSPDGSRLAFFDVSSAASGEASEQYALMVVDADGHHPVTVRDVGCCAGDDAVLPSVVWSPDGTLLGVATSDLGDATGIYTVHPDGSQWTERMPGNWNWLSWQPV